MRALEAELVRRLERTSGRHRGMGAVGCRRQWDQRIFGVGVQREGAGKVWTSR